MKTAYLALSLCLTTSMAGNAWGQELIINGGFDYGSNDWITSSIDNYGGWIATGGMPGGMFRLNDNGPIATDPTILQQVSTLPAMHYLLTGSYKKDYVSGCGACPSFAVDFDGSTVFTATAEAPAQWLYFSVEVVATGTSAVVQLRGEIIGTDTDWEIDNLSLVALAVPCLGDITGNYIVNSVDLAIVLSAWGSSGGEFAGTDINQDGIVNATDLTVLLSSWGPCP